MSRLRNILETHLGPIEEPRVTAGTDETAEPRKPVVLQFDREAMRSDLAALNRSNSFWFGVAVILVVALFIGAFVVVLTNLDRPQVIKTALSAFGITAAGAVTLMIQLWRSKTRTEMMMLLVVNMDAQTIRTVIQVLSKSI